MDILTLSPFITTTVTMDDSKYLYIYILLG